MNSAEHGEVSDDAMLEKGNLCNLYVHLQQQKFPLASGFIQRKPKRVGAYSSIARPVPSNEAWHF